MSRLSENLVIVLVTFSLISLLVGIFESIYIYAIGGANLGNIAFYFGFGIFAVLVVASMIAYRFGISFHDK